MSRMMSSTSGTPFTSWPRSFWRITLPKRRRASRCASSASMPARTYSRASASMWNVISCAMSSSRRLQVNSAISRRMRRGGRNAISRSLLECPQHPGNRLRQAQPCVVLGLSGGASFAGQRVELGFAVVFGGAPLGFDQALLFEPIEGGIQRPFLHFQHVIGELMKAGGDAVAVIGSRAQALEDEQVERALQEVELSDGHMPTLDDLSEEKVGFLSLDGPGKIPRRLTPRFTGRSQAGSSDPAPSVWATRAAGPRRFC